MVGLLKSRRSGEQAERTVYSIASIPRCSGEQAERTVRIFCLSPAAPYIHNTNNKMAKGHNYNKQPYRQ